jgi:hypothetical protein
MKSRLKDLQYKFKDHDEPSGSSMVNKLKVNNPKLWKKLKHQFDTGRKIVSIQLVNGLDKSNENTLRYYLAEYAGRFINSGPNSFPLSFNVLEPFFIFNHHNSVVQLIEEEESYGISLLDFLDYSTEPSFDIGKIDLFENIPEKLIYHFSFTDFDEYNFSNSRGKTFFISGVSIVRQGNEVSILMQAGESFDKQEAQDYFNQHTRESLEKGISPDKRALGVEISQEGEPRVVPFEGREDLWLHSVGALFDIETKSIDIRHIARDDNLSFSIITDDLSSILINENESAKERNKEFIESQLEELNNYAAVFDFAQYCLTLTNYIFENESRLVDVTYETKLSSLLEGPITKRKYRHVPSKYKLYAKPFYYLETINQQVFERKQLENASFKIDKSGYWKRIGVDENGFDKKGRKIVGKTWVERNDVYYTGKKGITKVNELKVFSEETAGHVYIMRQPTHEENIYKIGLTKRNVNERRKELSNTSSVDSFFVITSFYTKDCLKAEKQVHEALNEYRLSSRREFFICDLKIIIETCEKVVNTINES